MKTKVTILRNLWGQARSKSDLLEFKYIILRSSLNRKAIN